MYPYNKLYRFDRSIALSPQYQLGMYIYIYNSGSQHYVKGRSPDSGRGLGQRLLWIRHQGWLLYPGGSGVSMCMIQFWLVPTKSLFNCLFDALFVGLGLKYIYDSSLTWTYQVSVSFLAWCIVCWTWTHQVHIWVNSDLDSPSLCFIFCLLHFFDGLNPPSTYMM